MSSVQSPSASANIVETYLKLGLATPDARCWQAQGFRACVGDFEHPICNFAIDLKLGRDSVANLRDLALSSPSFCVYHISGDLPAEIPDLLESVGFRLSHILTIMVTNPATEGTPLSMALAKAVVDRRRVADFMSEQFFPGQNKLFKSRVAETTTRADSLELLFARSEGRISAASMVSDAAGMYGIYNVCVEKSLRGQGRGSAVMKELLERASLSGKPAVLQCSPMLAPWYRRLGFQQAGSVSIYSLFRGRR